MAVMNILSGDIATDKTFSYFLLYRCYSEIVTLKALHYLLFPLEVGENYSYSLLIALFETKHLEILMSKHPFQCQ